MPQNLFGMSFYPIESLCTEKNKVYDFTFHLAANENFCHSTLSPAFGVSEFWIFVVLSGV